MGDHTKPVITIIGTDDMTFEANHDYNYIDDGATCSDRVDGWINENIEVSGDVVTLLRLATTTSSTTAKTRTETPLNQLCELFWCKIPFAPLARSRAPRKLPVKLLSHTL